MVKSAAASVRSATNLKTAKMWITIPHGYLPGDDFPVYDASDTYLGTATVPAGYYGGDQLEFFRSMLHKKRSTKKSSAYGKTAAKQLRGAGDAAMSLAFTVVCIVLISKLVGWWRTRKRKTRKIGADYPSVPSASEARDAKRRHARGAERPAEGRSGVARRRGTTSAPRGRRALPGAARDAQGGDSMPQGLDRGQAARRGDAAGERRPRAVRQAPRGSHARRPRRAARVARPRRHRTQTRGTQGAPVRI